jgi:O-acetyl-ADP-ribose deacetylase (regulator of RNase III)
MQAEEPRHCEAYTIGRTYLAGRVRVLVGNICQQHVDAVVNAANWTLLGGGGVDGAIHEAGGPQILAECEALRRTRYPQGLTTGEAVITSGGLLPARYVIHTVGPVKGVHGEQDAVLLADCYTNSLALAVRHELRTLAIPAISTGIYGYPREEAAVVASEAMTRFLEKDSFLIEIRLVFFTEREARVFLTHLCFPTERCAS